MKTIVYIGGELPDKDASALRVISNAKALRAYGYRVILIGFSKEIHKRSKERFDDFESYLLPYPVSFSNWLSDLISIKSYLAIINNIGKVDSIICYNFHAIPLWKLIRYGKKNNIRIVADCTEWHTVYHLHGVKRIIKKADIQLRVKKIQFLTDGNIVISSFFNDYYKGCKNCIIPPLVDKYDTKWSQTEYSPHHATKLVYAGKMGIGKDQLSTCIEALYNLRGYKFALDIVGITLSEYVEFYPEHSNMIKSLGDKLSFHGRVDHVTAINYVKNADFSILVREHNRKNDSGFPTKLPESITCGTPVIATNFSDIKEYIQKNNLGVVVEDISQVETAFEAALQMDQCEIQLLKKNCIENSSFDYRTHISCLGEFMKKIIDGE